MHDPDVVAFAVRRPWPRRDSFRAPTAGRRWKATFRSPFWTVAGRGLYFPPIITVWHHEPGGRDSGQVCKHYARTQDPQTGKWSSEIKHGWRWHVHHWRIQIHPLQRLRRRVLTRCAWCSGRDHKRDYVNVSHQWDGPSGRWWRGEPALFHGDCSSVASAHRLCLCADPLLRYDGWGQCAVCGKYRSYGQVPDGADRLLAALPEGSRIPPEMRPRLETLWSERRARREAAS